MDPVTLMYSVCASPCVDDGNLSHKEFIKVMKSRVSRGLNKVCGVVPVCGVCAKLEV